MTAGDMMEEITDAEEAAPLRGTDTDRGIALFRETESTVIGTAERIDRTGEMSVTTISESVTDMADCMVQEETIAEGVLD